MKRLLGSYLQHLRGAESRVQFAKRVHLSYTFVREVELGNRLPSDEVLLEMAVLLPADARRLLLYAHCDRSPPLQRVLREADLDELWPEAFPETPVPGGPGR
jgi:hypothetical protein